MLIPFDKVKNLQVDEQVPRLTDHPSFTLQRSNTFGMNFVFQASFKTCSPWYDLMSINQGLQEKTFHQLQPYSIGHATSTSTAKVSFTQMEVNLPNLIKSKVGD